MTALTMRRRGAGAKGSKYLMTAASNPEVLASCYKYGLCANPNYMTYEEAAQVTTLIVTPVEGSTNNRPFQNNNNITHFEEFQFFGLTTVNSYSFYKTTNMSTIVLPPNITAIDNSAFNTCSKLTHIDIPSAVTSIGSNCFASCSSMQYVIVRAMTPPTLGNASVFGTSSSTYPIYVPDSSLNAYKTAWSDAASRIYPISEFVQP